MDFHEIDTKGKLWVQRVSTLPTYAATDIGRILYVTGEDAFYFGTASAFELWGSDIIPAGTKMVFYQNTAPDGWTIDGTVADAIIGIKGGSNAWNVNGGQLAGTWTQTNHTHSFSDSFSASHTHSMTHTHRWHLFSGGSNYTYQSNGSTALAFNTYASKSTIGLFSRAQNCDAYRWNQDSYTQNYTGTTGSGDASGTVSGTTGNGATANTWRPYAAMCIVATKD